LQQRLAELFEAMEKQLAIKFGEQLTVAEQRAALLLLGPDAIYARADELVGLLKESRKIERKPPGFQAKPLGEYLSMWSNTSPDGGLIAVGIADDGTIVGCADVEQKRLNELEKAGMDNCPDAKYDTKYVSVAKADGSSNCILLFRVHYHQTKVVETSDRRVFVRLGDSKKELKTDEERRQLRIDKGEVQHEKEPSGLIFPDDFDVDLINGWARNVRKYRGLTTESSDEKLLEIMHLGTRKGGSFVPNIACALIFASVVSY
jgi:ATP-dependent DNA helicase RecG